MTAKPNLCSNDFLLQTKLVLLAVTALTTRFEPPGKQELYLAEFSTRFWRPSKKWANYDEDLQRLSSKAYPELDANAMEQIALTRFVWDSQISFALKQKIPTTLDDAVAATMLLPHNFASMYDDEDIHISPSAINQMSNDESLSSQINQLSERI